MKNEYDTGLQHVPAACGMSRRCFVRGMGLVLLAPHVFVHTAVANTGEGRRWGLLVDTRLCTSSCTVCIEMCNKEHALYSYGRSATDPNWIRKVKVTDPTTGHVSYVPIMCQHCHHAPCVEACPTGACMRRADGIVLVDSHKCVGCRYCMLACPYKTRFFVNRDVQRRTAHSPRGKGTVEGCTLCVHRVDAGQLPACVEACTTQGKGAMLFGDLNDPVSDIAKTVVSMATVSLRPELQLDPSLRYLGVSL